MQHISRRCLLDAIVPCASCWICKKCRTGTGIIAMYFFVSVFSYIHLYRTSIVRPK